MPERQHVSPHELFAQPWAITEAAFRRVIAAATAFEANPESFLFLIQEEEPERRPYELVEGVAILEINGPLFRRGSVFSRFLGRSTYPAIAAAFSQAMEDPEARAIVLSIDSPGGDALGLAEVADQIYAARGPKPIRAVVRGLGASAAYFLASAADEIIVAREAPVGSIGCVATYFDFSELDKKIGIKEIEIVSSQSPKKRPDPSSKDGRAQIQREVDDIAQVFVDSVARNRGVSVETVLSDFGQGDVLVGERSVEAGLADRVGTLGQVVEELASARPGGPPRSLGSAVPGSAESLAETTAELTGCEWEQPLAEDLAAIQSTRPAGRGSSEGGERMETVQISQITSAWLEEHLPEVGRALRAEGEKVGFERGRAEGELAGLEKGRAEGAEAERKRILGIEEQALPGHGDLIAKLKADPKATPAGAAQAVLAAEREKRGAVLEQLRQDENDLGGGPSPSAGTPDGGATAGTMAAEIVELARSVGAVQRPKKD